MQQCGRLVQHNKQRREICTKRNGNSDVFLQKHRRLRLACTALKIDSGQVRTEDSAVLPFPGNVYGGAPVCQKRPEQYPEITILTMVLPVTRIAGLTVRRKKELCVCGVHEKITTNMKHCDRLPKWMDESRKHNVSMPVEAICALTFHEVGFPFCAPLGATLEKVAISYICSCAPRIG